MNISQSIQSSTASFAQDLFELLRESIVQDVRVALGINPEPKGRVFEVVEAAASDFLRKKEDERVLKAASRVLTPTIPLTPSAVAEILQRTEGNVRLAAQFLGVSPSTVKRYRARLKVASDLPVEVQKKKFATARRIRETLKETGGNVAETMRRLGCSRARINKFRSSP